jgi:diguanylate cyclase (GGDEF)-like protein/PAS domain S-box-containing protein
MHLLESVRLTNPTNIRRWRDRSRQGRKLWLSLAGQLVLWLSLELHFELQAGAASNIKGSADVVNTASTDRFPTTRLSWPIPGTLPSDLLLQIRPSSTLSQPPATTNHYLMWMLGITSVGAGIAGVWLLNTLNRVRQQQQAVEDRYYTLMQQATEGFFLVDTDTNFLLDANPAFERLLGYSLEELSTLTLDDLVIPRTTQIDHESGFVLKDTQPPAGEQLYCTKDGHSLPVDVRVAPTVYGDRQAWSVLFWDMTPHKQLLQAQQEAVKLQESQHALTTLINSLPGIVFTREPSSGFPIRFLSNGSSTVAGFCAEDLIEPDGLSHASLIDPEDQQRIVKTIAETIRDSSSYSIEYCIRTHGGEEKWLWERGAIIRSEAGDFISIDGFISDLTEMREAEHQLRLGALYDPLTELPNRGLFMDRLEHALRRTKRHAEYVFAVLFLDLDRFKVVNDSLGHLAGDELLVTVAQRLQTCLRPNDTIARLGGDEFTILVEDVTDIADVTHVSDRILSSLKEPVALGGHEVFTTVSIGIALSTTGYEHPQELLRDADIALYRAKALGKSRYEVFDTNMRIRAMELLQMETRLRQAMDREDLLLHYQPIVFLETGNVVGFETVLRWHHPDRGLISPSEFLPIAEETGLIVELDRWVLREACRQMQLWQQQFPAYSSLSVSVNLSSRQFAQPDLVDRISQILKETGIEANRLQIEITEGVIMQNAESAALKLNQLKKLGIRIGIDDFGTGYSSLSYLHQFPVDRLKIDRAFINGIDSQKNLEIVRTIVELAHSLSMDVVAEGVETGVQLAQVKAFGCEYGQGFWFSKALDIEGAEVFLQRGLTEQIDEHDTEVSTAQLKIKTNSGYSYISLVGKTSWKIGRSKDSAIFISDRWASQEHAILQIIGTDDIYLVDLGSRNGSFVNGQRLQVPVLLQHGDHIKIGRTEMEFQYTAKEPPAMPGYAPVAAAMQQDTEMRKTVLMIQPSVLQGEIWREALTSQGLSVIRHIANFEPAQDLEHFIIPKNSNIDLLLIDLQIPQLNPYAFCRWCRSHYPDLKVVFTTSLRTQVSPLDRRWAIQQGALDLLPAFREDDISASNLSEIVDRIQLILKALDWQTVNHTALVSAMSTLQSLIIRRETFF